jgi:hypothetical protein
MENRRILDFRIIIVYHVYQKVLEAHRENNQWPPDCHSLSGGGQECLRTQRGLNAPNLPEEGAGDAVFRSNTEGIAMEYIRVTKENLETEHICCAISNNKDVQVASKKAWLAQRFDEGLVFLKGAERGKCFIEYIPAEMAWNPILAEGYMYINCLWVSGSFKGHGYSNDLLDSCIRDSKSKGKIGLCILSAKKKKPFLADPKYLSYKGFSVCDEADNGIQLWHLPFEGDPVKPCFKECAKHPAVEEKGYVLYYTSQCPFNAKYVPLVEATAREQGVPFKAIHLESREEAQSAPTPITTYALFCDGTYLTNEQMNDKKFLKLLSR